jgi:hypothetical protein
MLLLRKTICTVVVVPRREFLPFFFVPFEKAAER